MRPKDTNSGNGDGLIASAKALYRRVPRRWHWALRPLEYCYSIYDALRPRFWIVQPEPRDQAAPVTILCAARRGDRSYLFRRIFGRAYRESFVGRAWLWNTAKVMAGKGKDCCLAVVTARSCFRRLLGSANWMYVPRWVIGELDLPLAPAVLRTNTVHSDLRRIHRNELTFEITHDRKQLEDFYRHMYVPYISDAHGDSAVVMSYETMKAQFHRCELLLVKKQGQAIAGVLILHAKTGTRLWCMGVRDANEQFLDDGAVAAIYHFAGQYLQSKGLRRMGVGLSRAFLRDGALRYKKKLGMRVTGAAPEYFAFCVPRNTEAARLLLQNTPWICEQDGFLYSAVFVEADRTPRGEWDFRRLHRDFFLEGLSQVLVIPLGSSSPTATPPRELAGRMGVPIAARTLGPATREPRIAS